MKSLKVLFFLLKTTFMAFGGGNALFPFIRKEAVEKNKWLSEKEFDKLVVTTNMIPGPSVVESLSYISMKVLGTFKGAVITLIGILPHILFALGLLILAEKFLPTNYLFVVNVSVIPVIIGVLLAFTWRFVRASEKEIGFPKMLGLLIFTVSFSLFVPSPWNITAFVMIGVIFLTIVFEYFKIRREGKE